MNICETHRCQRTSLVSLFSIKRNHLPTHLSFSVEQRELWLSNCGNQCFCTSIHLHPIFFHAINWLRKKSSKAVTTALGRLTHLKVQFQNGKMEPSSLLQPQLSTSQLHGYTSSTSLGARPQQQQLPAHQTGGWVQLWHFYSSG